MSKRKKEARAAAMRRASHGRDRPRCTYCGVPLSRKVRIFEPPVIMGGELTYPFTIDHVVPRARGGRDVLDNRVPCCCPCNSAKAQDDLVVHIARLGARSIITGEQARDMQRKAMEACAIRIGGTNGGPVLQREVHPGGQAESSGA